MDNSIESQNVDRMVITTFGSFLANSLAEWSKQVISLVQADSFKYIANRIFSSFSSFFSLTTLFHRSVCGRRWVGYVINILEGDTRTKMKKYLKKNCVQKKGFPNFSPAVAYFCCGANQNR